MQPRLAPAARHSTHIRGTRTGRLRCHDAQREDEHEGPRVRHARRKPGCDAWPVVEPGGEPAGRAPQPRVRFAVRHAALPRAATYRGHGGEPPRAKRRVRTAWNRGSLWGSTAAMHCVRRCREPEGRVLSCWAGGRDGLLPRRLLGLACAVGPGTQGWWYGALAAQRRPRREYRCSAVSAAGVCLEASTGTLLPVGLAPAGNKPRGSTHVQQSQNRGPQRLLPRHHSRKGNRQPLCYPPPPNGPGLAWTCTIRGQERRATLR